MSEFSNITIQLFLEIRENFEKYKDIIDNLTSEEFELLKLYISLAFKEIDNLKTQQAIDYQEKIIFIKNEIKEKIININEIDNLIKIKDINVLDKIRNNKLDISKITDVIKDKLVNIGGVKDIFQLQAQIENNKKKSICFLDYKNEIAQIENIKISSNGFNLENIDLSKEKYSNGQKIIFIFEKLLDCFIKSNKTIILDDVFEKLDIQNSVKLINLIFDKYLDNNFNIEILTHDENFVTLFKNVLQNREDKDVLITNILEKTILKTGKKESIETTPLSLTFENYIRNIVNNNKKECDKECNIEINKDINRHLLFIKYFNRKNFSNNMMQLLEVEKRKDQIFDFEIEMCDLYKNKTWQIYNFLSENIFHYEENINIDDYPLIKKYFDDDILKNSKNTVEFYENMIKEFDNEGSSKYGVDMKKVTNFLKEILIYIKDEETYFKENKETYLDKKRNNPRFSKFNFFSNMEIKKNDRDYKDKRNKILHELEYSLTAIRK